MSKHTPQHPHDKIEASLHHDKAKVDALAGSPKGAVKMPWPSLDTGGGSEPHDGRVHSGFTGDDGAYVSTGSTGTAASSQPGSVGDLGAQQLPRGTDNDAADRTTSHTRRDATISSSRRTDRGDADNDSDAFDDVDSQENGHDIAVENVDRADQPPRSRTSNLEQPSGDGNYQKAADHTVSNADDTESERD